VSGQLYASATFSTWKGPFYSLDRRIGDFQGRSGRFGEERNLLCLPEIETRPSRSLVTTPTELTPLRIVVHQGRTNFPKTQKLPQNSKHHHTKFRRPGARDLCTPVVQLYFNASCIYSICKVTKITWCVEMFEIKFRYFDFRSKRACPCGTNEYIVLVVGGREMGTLV
jgi:hypothetical protein